MDNFVICPYCNQKFKQITLIHLKKHGKNFEDLKKDFPDAKLCSDYVVNKRKQTCLNRYGVESTNSLKSVQEKKKQTLLKRYGVDCPSKSEIAKQKTKKTNLKKYGTEYVFQSEDVKEKIKDSIRKKYNVDNASQSEEIKKKKIETSLRNNNVSYCMQNPEILKKKNETMIKKYGVINPLQSDIIKDKFKQTCIDKFGVINPFASESIKEKIRKTNLEKYGVENISKNKEIKKKQKNTLLLKYGVECPYQNIEIKRKGMKKFYDEFINKINIILNELNLILLDSEYINAHYNHQWQCKKCGKKFITNWNAIQQGYTCPDCYPRNNGKSKAEEEINNFINQLGFATIRNTREIISPKELDIYIPEKNIAIEYCGIYWHSEQFLEKNYHLDKLEKCLEKNIRLITIFEDEWIFKKEIVKNRLCHILQKNSARIHARKCIIKEISTKEKNDFLEKYHIQGRDICKVKLGAFYDNELIAVMTFSHGNISKGSSKIDDIWELNRFCTKTNCIITGITSKLLSYFKKNFEWKEIFSYADRRWSNGDVYFKLNFKLSHKTKVNYWYIKNFERIHRFNLRKTKDDPKEIPEHILRLKEGYTRIFDCGNLKFLMTKEG